LVNYIEYYAIVLLRAKKKYLEKVMYKSKDVIRSRHN